MFLLQYDFRIELYDSIKDERGKPKLDDDGVSLLDKEPKFVFETKNGAPVVEISFTNRYSTNYIIGKEGSVNIYNLPLDFDEYMFLLDGIKMYYKPMAWMNEWYFIASGRIELLEETDVLGSGFQISYKISTSGDFNFVRKQFKPPIQCKGRTVIDVIKEVMGDRAVIKMTPEEQAVIINEDLAIATPQELFFRFGDKYVTYIYRDLSYDDHRFDSVYVFKTTGWIKQSIVKYIELEDYQIFFIPQKEFSSHPTYGYYIIHWNCQVAYTHELKVGDHVSFIDTLGKVVKTTIVEASFSLTNIGECVLNLKLYDDTSNTLQLEKIV